MKCVCGFEGEFKRLDVRLRFERKDDADCYREFMCPECGTLKAEKVNERRHEI